MPSKTLSERERRFVNSYLHEFDGNATKAAIAAGYSAATARQQGSRLLTRAHVQAALNRVADKAELSTAQALQNVSALASVVPDKVSDAVILKANELILRVRGALNDKHGDSRITVNIGFLVRCEPTEAETVSYEEVLPRQARLISAEE